MILKYCDLCGATGASLNELVSCYQAYEVKEVCGKCLKQLENYNNRVEHVTCNIKKVWHKALLAWLLRKKKEVIPLEVPPLEKPDLAPLTEFKVDPYAEFRWRGKDVLDLTIEELREACFTLGRMYNKTLAQHKEDMRILIGRRP